MISTIALLLSLTNLATERFEVLNAYGFKFLFCQLHCKNIRISTDILWRVFNILTEPNVGPALHYSVDLRIQTYTHPVPLKYEKKTLHKISMDIRMFFTVYRMQGSVVAHELNSN